MMVGGHAAIRGTLFDFIDDPWQHVGHEPDAARFLPDGLLVIQDGRITDFGPFAEVSGRIPGSPSPICRIA